MLFIGIYKIYEFVWFSFMAYQSLCVRSCQILLIGIYLIYMIWFCFVLWHINRCRLFNAKSFLYIYIKYIWFGFVVLWHIDDCRLFNTKSSLYIHKYKGFSLIGFYGLLTLIGYLMSNPLYTYILNIYDLCTHFVDNIFEWALAHSFANN